MIVWGVPGLGCELRVGILFRSVLKDCKNNQMPLIDQSCDFIKILIKN